ncbi:MAG: acyl--CoA ligase [Actinomycetales bacterium]|nr:acyl--CoA ligase [Actinomycetales bacterium]
MRETDAHLVRAVLDRCARTPDTVALRAWSGALVGRRLPGTARDLTYRELGTRIETTAAALRAEGLETGDRVLFSIRPRPEGIVLALAIVLAGGSIVFVDPGSTPELFAARLAAARPRFAATEALLYALSSGPLRRLARSRGLLLPGYGHLDVRHLYSGPWLPGVPRGARRVARLTDHSAAPLDVSGTSGDEALVVFTSGTTAAPRAVVHTAGSLAAASHLLAGVHALEPGEVVHTDQMLLGLPALLAGATWSIPARPPGRDIRRFVAEGWGESARRAAAPRASSTFLVPADVTALLDAHAAGTVPPVEGTVLVGGAPVTKNLLARTTTALPHVRWVAVYGATEMLPIAAVDATEKLAFDGDGDLVGTPLPGVQARVCDGELHVSGPSLMRGYLGQDPAREHATGDLARIDERGRIALLGRTRDMIIRGTVNIYPGLFEPRIEALPGVADAVLVGLPRDDGDERVALVLTAARHIGGTVPTTASPGEPPSSGMPSSALGVEVVRDSSLVREVSAALPGVLDHGALPDLVVEVRAIPTAGRSRKPDRRALAAALAGET